MATWSAPAMERIGSQLRQAARACEAWAVRAPFRFSLVAVLVLISATFAIVGPSYETNDDVFITMIASGKGFCPAPDEHLIFSNVLIGHVLKRLYTAWPLVPWYGCHLLLAHYAAQVALLYCALTVPRPAATTGGGPCLDASAHPADDCKRDSVRQRLAIYLVYFAIVELLFLNTMQFTTTAFLAAQAGVFLLWLAARRCAQQPSETVIPVLMAAAGLLVWAALIRIDGLAMALVVAAPLGIYLARETAARALLPSAVAGACAAIVVLAAVNYDRASYDSDPRWRDFFDYNQLRVKFTDYRWTSYTQHTARLFSSVGWSKNDHEMMTHLFFDDPQLYDKQKLRTIVDGYPWQTARLTPAYFKEVCRRLLQDRAVWATILVLPFCLAVVDRRRAARSAVLVTALVGVALVVFLILYCKLPPRRAYFPLVSFAVSVAMLFPSRSPTFGWRSTEGNPHDNTRRQAWNAWQAQSHRTRVVVTLLVVGLVMGVHHQCRHSARAHRERSALLAFLNGLDPAECKALVSWEAALPYEVLSPLDNLNALSRVPLVSMAWMVRTHWHEETKRRCGISNVARALAERDDIELVATPTHRSLFTTFAKEHFQAEVEFVPLAEVGKRFVAGRFQPLAVSKRTASEQAGAVKRY